MCIVSTAQKADSKYLPYFFIKNKYKILSLSLYYVVRLDCAAISHTYINDIAHIVRVRGCKIKKILCHYFFRSRTNTHCITYNVMIMYTIRILLYGSINKS